MLRTALFLGIAVALLAASAGASTITQNGGFNTGDFTGWSTNTCATCGAAGWYIGAIVSDPGTLPTDTTYAAKNACVGASCSDAANGDWLAQTLATTAGQTYTLTFLYDAGGAGTTTELDVLWDGSLVEGGQIVNATPRTWAQYTFTGLSASSAATVLEFTGNQDPSVLYLTDISVTPEESTVPEPASWTLLAGALLGIGGLLRRKP